MSCGGPALSRHGHRVVTYGDATLTVMKTTGEALCGVLRAAIEESPDAAEGLGSVPDRAAAALYFLLMDHSVDRDGRCRSCRRPGAAFGSRRRRCRVHMKAAFWLLQPRPPQFATAATSDFGRWSLLTDPRARRPDSAHGGTGVQPPSSGPTVSHSLRPSSAVESYARR